ncbi:MAG: hypothetical protein IPI73_24155 [Betaproteobacteria bacterium]|nr:hypothetical protein [Betaproteobacteria bacterium]
MTSARPVALLALAQSQNTLEASITLEATSVAFVPEYALTVSTVGNGTVASTDGRVNCGYDCAVVYTADTRITLIASAATGSVFGGWQGACDAVATTCTVTMSASQHVMAIFALENSPPVVEFHNAALDHYFITAEPAEAAAIDAGSAGPGWSRTGLSFKQGGDTPVCRYYGSVAPGPNSHFYSAFAEECSLLAQLEATTPDAQRRWNSEGFGFVTSLPLNGAVNRERCRCIARTTTDSCWPKTPTIAFPPTRPRSSKSWRVAGSTRASRCARRSGRRRVSVSGNPPLLARVDSSGWVSG